MTKRILIMAGGTGGHVFPGLAVADYLSEWGWQVHWLGTAEKMESRVVPAAGYPIHYLKISGLRKNGILRLVAAPFKIVRAVWQALWVMRQFRPQVVLGMGGFASGPGGIAAWLSRIPLVIHEQNAVAGLTNRILFRFATKTLTGFEQTFPSNSSAWVGNPVRQSLLNLTGRESIVSPIRVLVLGGSQGARPLNQALPGILAQCPPVQVYHQCGAGNHDSVERAYKNAGMEQGVSVAEFIDDMAAAYQWADLVVCRSGALTVSEIACAGIAAVFVPLPHAVDDHQTKNASMLVAAGAARLLPQKELDTEHGKQILLQLIGRPALLGEMARAAKALARPDATEAVATICKQQVEKRL